MLTATSLVMLVLLPGSSASTVPPLKRLAKKLKVRHEVVDSKLVTTVQRKGRGFFMYGLGKEGNIADGFLVEFTNKKPLFKECKGQGQEPPICTSSGTRWRLVSLSKKRKGCKVVVETSLDDEHAVDISKTSNQFCFLYSRVSVYSPDLGAQGNSGCSEVGVSSSSSQKEHIQVGKSKSGATKENALLKAKKVSDELSEEEEAALRLKKKGKKRRKKSRTRRPRQEGEAFGLSKQSADSEANPREQEEQEGTTPKPEEISPKNRFFRQKRNQRPRGKGTANNEKEESGQKSPFGASKAKEESDKRFASPSEKAIPIEATEPKGLSTDIISEISNLWKDAFNVNSDLSDKSSTRFSYNSETGYKVTNPKPGDSFSEQSTKTKVQSSNWFSGIPELPSDTSNMERKRTVSEDGNTITETMGNKTHSYSYSFSRRITPDESTANYDKKVVQMAEMPSGEDESPPETSATKTNDRDGEKVKGKGMAVNLPRSAKKGQKASKTLDEPFSWSLIESPS